MLPPHKNVSIKLNFDYTVIPLAITILNDSLILFSFFLLENKFANENFLFDSSVLCSFIYVKARNTFPSSKFYH